MKLNPNWSNGMKIIELEIREHLCIGNGLVYIPCMWTIDAISLLNRESYGLTMKTIYQGTFCPHFGYTSC